MKGIWSDKGKFQLIGDASTHDNTVQHEKSLQAFLLRAKKASQISSEVYKRIRPVAYRVGLRAQANVSAQTFKPAHKVCAGQRAAL